MNYDNYIFDLYGTLIDIHTDEEDPGLWRKMCDYLDRKFKAHYTPAALRKRYLEVCAEEEKKLSKRIEIDNPEIRISWVWERLIAEKNRNFKLTCGSDSEKYGEKEITTPQIRELCIFFRETSRDKMLVYRGVHETLKSLKADGKKIFLLSNAQHLFTEKELSDCNLTDYFDDIYISSDKMMKKPQPEFMEMLLSKNKLDREKCVMIGNEIKSDVGVACACKVRSIYLNTYSHSIKEINQDVRSLEIENEVLLPKIISNGDIRRII